MEREAQWQGEEKFLLGKQKAQSWISRADHLYMHIYMYICTIPATLLLGASVTGESELQLTGGCKIHHQTCILQWAPQPSVSDLQSSQTNTNGRGKGPGR